MAKPVTTQAEQDASAVVVVKATLRAAQRLQISTNQLGAILGVSKSTISRLKTNPRLKPKKADLALQFIRAYRSLIGIVESHEAAVAWMHSQNEDLGGTPIDLMGDVAGLMRTVRYLDAMRAKV